MTLHTLLEPPIPSQEEKIKYWTDLQESSVALAIASAYQRSENSFLVIVPNITIGLKIENAAKFYMDSSYQNEITLFPDRETLPFDQLSPHADLTSERMQLLFKLPKQKKFLLIISINTLMHLLPPRTYINQNTFVLNIKDTLFIQNFRNDLEKFGYCHTPTVRSHGEYSIRGGIFDIFPMGSEKPIRFELFDNEVESIRIFDPETQVSCEPIQTIRILPAKEFPITDESIKLFKDKWQQRFDLNPKNCEIYQSISKKIPLPGCEYYLPLFFENLETLFDYLPKDILICNFEGSLHASIQFYQEAENRYEQINFDKYRSILSPSEILIKPENLENLINNYKKITIHSNETNNFSFNCEVLPSINIITHNKEPLQKLEHYIKNSCYKILLVIESEGRKDMLLSLLQNINLSPTLVDNWKEYLESEGKLFLCIGQLTGGFVYKILNICVITGNELFGYSANTTKRSKKKNNTNFNNIINDLNELEIGVPVVHMNYGIGRYLGLKVIQTKDIISEFICLEYADSALIYVPITSLQLINRYVGFDSENVQLNKLGTDQWEKAKNKALAQIQDVAAELLDIYAIRKQQTGFKFQLDEKNYALFCSKFEFDETPDQQKAINDVFEDMMSEKTMDRLICGDVGFGKTEVAMRAAFLAASNGKQVAVLVPTTLLATQHYETFTNRFSGFNFSIEYISRFKTRSESTAIANQIKEGKVDIIIGTHALLQSNIKFADLGLLIIDEEHRFGVKQKEYLKSFRSKIDILALTATPIPRTLNMSLSGIRDISIITTPPERRLSIKTFINTKNKSLIREAIMREFLRGGQVYYLHNNIQTIQIVCHELKNLVPEAQIEIAHGQLPEKTLERIMSDFYHNKFNLLLCTTIIETGIDIPSANTIIIDRADKFGLSQLHQLRGRVGRSHHQAYAYLITPDKKLLTSDAIKRLDALSALGELGSGYNLATYDLEIRGSGELLGHEQSGNIQKIGFSLFTELLDKTIKAVKYNTGDKSQSVFNDKCEINLSIPAIIPEKYIYDVKSRLTIYKRIANANTNDELDQLQVELIDRFGLLPVEVKNLFKITEYKLVAHQIGINKIELTNKGGFIEFVDKPNIAPEQIISLIKNRPNQFRLSGSNRLSIKNEFSSQDQKLKFLNDLFNIHLTTCNTLRDFYVSNSV